MTRAVPLILLLLSAFLPACVSKTKYEALSAETERLRKDVEAVTAENESLAASAKKLEEENAALKVRLTDLGDNVAKLVGEKGQLASDLADTREKEARLRREQEAQRVRISKYRQIVTKFKEMTDSGKLRILVVRGQMVVQMPSGILFPSGKTTLTSEGKKALDDLAQVLKTIKERTFQVAGHTDNVPVHGGKYPSNWELSTERAVTVVKFFQEAGVDPVTLSAAGFAEYKPVAKNDTEEDRAVNRRIEIVLLPNLDELPDLSELQDELVAKDGTPAGPP